MGGVQGTTGTVKLPGAGTVRLLMTSRLEGMRGQEWSPETRRSESPVE